MTKAIHYAPGASTPLCNFEDTIFGKAGPPSFAMTRIPSGVTCRACLAKMPEPRVVKRFEMTHVSLNGDGTYGLGGRVVYEDEVIAPRSSGPVTGRRADRIVVDELQDSGDRRAAMRPWWVER